MFLKKKVIENISCLTDMTILAITVSCFLEFLKTS